MHHDRGGQGAQGAWLRIVAQTDFLDAHTRLTSVNVQEFNSYPRQDSWSRKEAFLSARDA